MYYFRKFTYNNVMLDICITDACAIVIDIYGSKVDLPINFDVHIIDYKKFNLQSSLQLISLIKNSNDINFFKSILRQVLPKYNRYLTNPKNIQTTINNIFN